MTLADLHNIPKFAELFVDPRFIALVNYRREHIGKSEVKGTHAEAIISQGGHKDGWLDCLNSFSELANPPKPGDAPKDSRLYAERPR